MVRFEYRKNANLVQNTGRALLDDSLPIHNLWPAMEKRATAKPPSCGVSLGFAGGCFWDGHIL